MRSSSGPGTGGGDDVAWPPVPAHHAQGITGDLHCHPLRHRQSARTHKLEDNFLDAYCRSAGPVVAIACA